MHRAHYDYDAARSLRLGGATPAEKRLHARVRLEHFRAQWPSYSPYARVSGARSPTPAASPPASPFSPPASPFSPPSSPFSRSSRSGGSPRAARRVARPASAAELGVRRPHFASGGALGVIEQLKQQAMENDVQQLHDELELTGRTLSEANLRLEEEHRAAMTLAAEAERLRKREHLAAAVEEAREHRQILERERLARATEQLTVQRAQLDEHLRSARSRTEAIVGSIKEQKDREIQELTSQLHRLAEEVMLERKRWAEQLKQVEEEKRELREAMESKTRILEVSNTPGDDPSRHRARMLHTCDVFLRRILRQALFRGWETWAEWHATQLRIKRLMTASRSRLLRPKLVATFAAWRNDFKNANLIEAERVARERAAKAAQLSRERDVLVEDLARIKIDFERQLAAVRAEKEAIEEQLATMKRSYERQLEAAQQEKQQELMSERAKHFAQLQDGFALRLMQKSVSRGFRLWAQQLRDRKEMDFFIKRFGGRVSRPRVLATFSAWRQDWQLSPEGLRFDRELSSRVATSQKLEKLEKERDDVMLENRRLMHENELRTQEANLSMISARDDRRTVLKLSKELGECKKALFECRDQDAHTRASKKQIDVLTSALADAVDAARRQREEGEQVMRKVLEEQRKTYEARLRQVESTHKEALEAASAMRQALEIEVHELRVRDIRREEARNESLKSEFHSMMGVKSSPQSREKPRYSYQFHSRSEQRSQMRGAPWNSDVDLSRLSKYEPQALEQSSSSLTAAADLA